MVGCVIKIGIGFLQYTVYLYVYIGAVLVLNCDKIENLGFERKTINLKKQAHARSYICMVFSKIECFYITFYMFCNTFPGGKKISSINKQNNHNRSNGLIRLFFILPVPCYFVVSKLLVSLKAK